MSLVFVCQYCPWQGDTLDNNNCPSCGTYRVVNQIEPEYVSITMAEMSPSQRFQLHAQWATTLRYYAATMRDMAYVTSSMSRDMEVDPECDPNRSPVSDLVKLVSEKAEDLAEKMYLISKYSPLRFITVSPPPAPNDEEFPF